jgi:hypothetical protein
VHSPSAQRGTLHTALQIHRLGFGDFIWSAIVISAVEHKRNRVALASRLFGPQSKQAIEARADLATAKVEQFVARTLADAPPLTDAQVERVIRALGTSQPTSVFASIGASSKDTEFDRQFIKNDGPVRGKDEAARSANWETP